MNKDLGNKDLWYQSNRLGGLRRFAIAITAFNVLGHTLFGFEQSIAQPLVALATAYSLELLFESLDAWAGGRQPRFAENFSALVHFLLSAHITGLAVAMLLYANDRLLPIAFATAVAIGSKAIFRVSVGERSRHFFNPHRDQVKVFVVQIPVCS
jgi:enediyne biosynthesis protein E5